MTKIEIFGTGCPNCLKTEKNIKNVIKELNLEVELVKVQDINKITERGVALTPAVALDQKMKVSGKVPSEKEIKSWFE
ncbi:MAG: thioredoxin family protein [Halanaerobiales bacterium]|nr:thioredoxin family protein [Halanaerobiales bacterium]